MNNLGVPPVLVLLGGLLLLCGLPLQWSTVATIDGRLSVSQRGIDYAGYDIATTVVLALLLAASAFALAAGRRWARPLAAVAAILACFWGVLVYLAAADPSDGGVSSRVAVSVGIGAYMLGVGALIALAGAVLSFRGRGVPVVASGVQPGR